jgi:hypothetical protein
MDVATAVTHGLSVSRKVVEGRTTLYVVSHGGREAIEVFELDLRGALPAASWIGCMPLPEGMAGNSVTSFEDGAVAATVPIVPGMTLADALAGKPTGAVLLWPAGGHAFTVLPGASLPFNNGIEAAPTGDEYFVAATSAREVAAFSRSDPNGPRRTVKFDDVRVDNIHWTADGRLITAGRVKAAGCEDDANCPHGWAVYTLDPASLTPSLVSRGDAGPTIFGVSTGMIFGADLWLGSSAADRIAWRTLPDKTPEP